MSENIVKNIKIKKHDGSFETRPIGINYTNVEGLATEATAAKAERDGNGNIIHYTYLRDANLLNDGSVVFSTGYTTLPPKRWKMTAASSSVDGRSGFVPKPVAGDNMKFLRGDGTWVSISQNSMFEFVQTLPTENINPNVIYLVPDPESSSSTDTKIEYIYDTANEKWEKIGTTDMDLSGYVQKTDIANKGSSTQPVYIDSNGVARPITAEIPADAAFTDTHLESMTILANASNSTSAASAISPGSDIYLNHIEGRNSSYDVKSSIKIEGGGSTAIAVDNGALKIASSGGSGSNYTSKNVVNTSSSSVVDSSSSTSTNGAYLNHLGSDGTTTTVKSSHKIYGSGNVQVTINKESGTETNIKVHGGGVSSIQQGSTNGTISVETPDGINSVAVKGLMSAAYRDETAFAGANHYHDMTGKVNNSVDILARDDELFDILFGSDLYIINPQTGMKESNPNTTNPNFFSAYGGAKVVKETFCGIYGRIKIDDPYLKGILDQFAYDEEHYKSDYLKFILITNISFNLGACVSFDSETESYLPFDWNKFIKNNFLADYVYTNYQEKRNMEAWWAPTCTFKQPSFCEFHSEYTPAYYDDESVYHDATDYIDFSDHFNTLMVYPTFSEGYQENQYPLLFIEQFDPFNSSSVDYYAPVARYVIAELRKYPASLYEVLKYNNPYNILLNLDESWDGTKSIARHLQELKESQSSLIAGDNITIENGVISATVPTYTAGEGISINNGEISVNYPNGDNGVY